MKTITTRNLRKYMLAVACILFVPLVSQAVPSLTESAAFGYVDPGPTPANAVDDTAAVNAVIWRINNGPPYSASPYDAVGQTYGVLIDPGTLPYAVYAGSGATTGNDQKVDLGLGGYRYLSVKYDGATGALLLWDILGLSGIQTVPEFYPATSNDKANNYNLFTGTDIPPDEVVPDGGASLALLGVGLLGLAALKRRLS